MKRGFPGDSEKKYLPAEKETSARSLGQEDPLEECMAAHSSIHAWTIPWMEEPGGLQSMGLQRVGHNYSMHTRYMKRLKAKHFTYLCLIFTASLQAGLVGPFYS